MNADKDLNWGHKSADRRKYLRPSAFICGYLPVFENGETSNLPAEKTRLQRQVEATDREIDHLVYQLYDLTPEEIAIVEGQSG